MAPYHNDYQHKNYHPGTGMAGDERAKRVRYDLRALKIDVSIDRKRHTSDR